MMLYTKPDLNLTHMSFTSMCRTWSLEKVCVLKLGHVVFKGIYFVIYGIISEFTDKGQFEYLTNLKGPQEGTYLYTTQFLSLR